MRRKPAGDPRPPLSDGVVAVLLGGWSAHARTGASDDGLFELFSQRDQGMAALWRAHESYLRAEAQRLHIKPPYDLPDGRRVFFAEFCTLPLAVQMAYWQAQTARALAAIAADDDE
jgi:hypothetical protein